MRRKISTIILLCIICTTIGACGKETAASEDSNNVSSYVSEPVSVEGSRAQEEDAEPGVEKISSTQENDELSAYAECRDLIVSLGRTKHNDYFDGYVYEFPMDPSIAEESQFARFIGATESSNSIWVINEP